MTEFDIIIGGRTFSVACDNEEQEKVKDAALLINEEAETIQAQLGRLPESKMLLLSSLMRLFELWKVSFGHCRFKISIRGFVPATNGT